MERVNSFKGNDSSVLIVVPHGYDDPNTAVIAESIIKELGCYGVINRGWERAEKYDYYADKANCNNVDHCHEDVVFDEFLYPILKHVFSMINDGYEPNIFIIHGVSNSVRHTVGGDALDLIVGTGNGNPPSLTCPEWYKNCFMEKLYKSFRVYEGKAGGKYSGRGKTNLNQLFRFGKYLNKDVFSVQIEVIRELREEHGIATLTGEEMAKAIEDVVEIRESGERNAVPVMNFPKDLIRFEISYN